MKDFDLFTAMTDVDDQFVLEMLESLDDNTGNLRRRRICRMIAAAVVLIVIASAGILSLMLLQKESETAETEPVSVSNEICADKHYAAASTTITASDTDDKQTGAVYSTFYVLNTATNSMCFFEEGNEGINGGEVSGTRAGNEIIFKVVSDHSATVGFSHYHYDTTCIAP
jgi:hypothetical protein